MRSLCGLCFNLRTHLKDSGTVDCQFDPYRLLRVCAVDWEHAVWVNGEPLGDFIPDVKGLGLYEGSPFMVSLKLHPSCYQCNPARAK